MTEQPASQGPTSTLPPQSANGTSPQLPAAPARDRYGWIHTRISGLRTGLTKSFAALNAQLRQITRRA
jgi:hypothetical protein